MLDDTQRRLETIKSAWIFAGVIAAVCGMMGYFGIAGTSEIFTKFSRAAGTFKDPNVLGPFLAAPTLLLVQGYMTGSLKRPLLSFPLLLILLGGVFFSFSRGAWGVVLAASVLTGALLVITGGSARTRARVILIGVVGAVFLAFVIAAILSVDSVRDLFEQRFALVQDYDGGARGRFGKLGTAISMLLDRPNGFGPQHFEDFFPEAPHNVYVAAFSAYGWLGGIAYLALIAITVRIGWSTVWRRTPWQGLYIALWSVTFFQLIQGFQIDTDHWRHLWLLVGLTWGVAVISTRSQPAAQRFAAEMPGFEGRALRAAG
jgi:O-antigen ligase